MLCLSSAAQKPILLQFLSSQLLLHKAGTCFAHYTAVKKLFIHSTVFPRVMFASHRPRVFRSRLGCCICGAKSSSSRFTSSSKYELLFSGCFQLNEKRQGEICNACVLLVKRWKKLPPGSSKNWKHVRKEMSIDVVLCDLRNFCHFIGRKFWLKIYFPRYRLQTAKQLLKELRSQEEVQEL